jgi:lipoyl-dependent peroxiredoxin
MFNCEDESVATRTGTRWGSPLRQPYAEMKPGLFPAARPARHADGRPSRERYHRAMVRRGRRAMESSVVDSRAKGPHTGSVPPMQSAVPVTSATDNNGHPSKVLYTARVHTTGGREGGISRSDDGRLDITHSVPGAPGKGTNPEQLFAAGWSTCFESALAIEARKRRVELPAGFAIDAEVDLCFTDDGYIIRGRLNVSLPGMDPALAKALAVAADHTCPYSKAIAGNISTAINVV